MTIKIIFLILICLPVVYVCVLLFGKLYYEFAQKKVQ